MISKIGLLVYNFIKSNHPRRKTVKIFLLKDVENIGMAGEIINVKDGFAANFIIPKKLGVVITPENEELYKSKIKTLENRKQVIASKTSMLAEKIKSLKIIIKRKAHEDKLYGSITTSEIADLLSDEGVKVAKNQVVLDKAIKSTGTYEVTVKLSNQLKPSFKLKVISE